MTREAISENGPISLSALVSCLLERHSDRGFARVLRTCSVLVGDRQVSSAIPGDMRVQLEETGEFLPPVAGGGGLNRSICWTSIPILFGML